MVKKMNLNQIVRQLISDLGDKEREVIVRHFGIGKKERESLASIGKEWGLSRERVRQIKDRALQKLREKVKKATNLFLAIDQYFSQNFGVKREDLLIQEWGGNEIILFLVLSGKYKREKESKEFFAMWIKDKESLERAKNLISRLIDYFEKTKKIQKLESLALELKMEKQALKSVLEISKILGQNKEGFWGLRKWPEIYPRGLKDKAYLVFKKLQKPLHFMELAKMIPEAKVESLHNELIKDPRFVLVGRGIYALREWGYIPGEVKDVILQILKQKGRPMTKEEILKEIQKQRIV
ncbi:hypothetical protein H5T58_01970, partial [Candidatus Parcubacteria bacterium]|nr:hypothetical protein [Candidatus Parcubacteria bacterium]